MARPVQEHSIFMDKIMYNSMCLSKQVLLWWRNFKADLTCGTLITKLKEWQGKGFVTENVWDKIRDLLYFEIPVRSIGDKLCDQKGNATEIF